MSTNRLYHLDSYQRDFTAKIIKRAQIDQKPAVMLDSTLFYPTSGGQMHDVGTLNDRPVSEVILDRNEIWHILDEMIEGDEVHGEINWPRRFDFMQQHTAFHILAQSFLRAVRAETVSSHLGERFSTIDVNLAEIAPLDLETVERLANRIIWENRPVRAFYKREKSTSLPMRHQPELDQEIRLVEISDFDLDPCGGTHVNRTGEVGLVKITSQEKIRGILRFTFVAGDRAFNEFQRLSAIIKSLSDALTTGSDEILNTVYKMSVEVKEHKRRAQRFEEMVIEAGVRELQQRAAECTVVQRMYVNADMAFLRRLAGAAVKSGKGTYLLGSQGESPCLVFATSDPNIDLRPVLDEVMPEINGRGGGSPAFVQGGGDRPAGLERALERARERAREMVLAGGTSAHSRS